MANDEEFKRRTKMWIERERCGWREREIERGEDTGPFVPRPEHLVL